MKLEKSSPESIALFARVAPEGPEVVHKKMFGFPCCFANGNMFAGLHGNSLIVRLGPEKRAELLKTDGSQIFEPMAGRPMKEYVQVGEGLLKDENTLRQWLREGLSFAMSLPPKESKKR